MGTWIASPIPVGWRLDLARSLLHPRPSPFTTFLLQGADGKQRDSWGITAVRIVDLAVTPDFTRLVVVGECATGIPANHSTPFLVCRFYVFRVLVFWFGFLVFWFCWFLVFGFLVFWFSGFLDFWFSGLLVFGFLGF